MILNWLKCEMFVFADVSIYAPFVHKIMIADLMPKCILCSADLMSAIEHGGYSNFENSEFERFVYIRVHHDKENS